MTGNSVDLYFYVANKNVLQMHRQLHRGILIEKHLLQDGYKQVLF
jgi:hypothetical protein